MGRRGKSSFGGLGRGVGRWRRAKVLVLSRFR